MDELGPFSLSSRRIGVRIGLNVRALIEEALSMLALPAEAFMRASCLLRRSAVVFSLLPRFAFPFDFLLPFVWTGVTSSTGTVAEGDFLLSFVCTGVTSGAGTFAEAAIVIGESIFLPFVI